MAETEVTTPETNQEPPAPVVATTTPPSVDNGTQTTADADALRKAKEQAEMERNLLRKKLDALEKEKSDRERKELEEKEDFRSLAEKTQAELDEYRKRENERETQAARSAATSEVYASFDPKVVEVAKISGIEATDDSDEAKAALQEKLESIQKTLGVGKPPVARPNNPAPSTRTEPNKAQNLERMRWDIPQVRNEAVHSAISGLESVKAMKAASGHAQQEI